MAASLEKSNKRKAPMVISKLLDLPHEEIAFILAAFLKNGSTLQLRSRTVFEYVFDTFKGISYGWSNMISSCEKIWSGKITIFGNRLTKFTVEWFTIEWEFIEYWAKRFVWNQFFLFESVHLACEIKITIFKIWSLFNQFWLLFGSVDRKVTMIPIYPTFIEQTEK